MSDFGFDFIPYSITEDSVTEVIVSVRRLNQLINDLQGTKKQLSDLQEKYDRAVEVVNSYADTGLFCPNVFGSDADQQQCSCGRTHLVGGRKAREFLKSIEEEE